MLSKQRRRDCKDAPPAVVEGNRNIPGTTIATCNLRSGHKLKSLRRYKLDVTAKPSKRTIVNAEI
jgi:hypothetical protein